MQMPETPPAPSWLSFLVAIVVTPSLVYPSCECVRLNLRTEFTAVGASRMDFSTVRFGMFRVQTLVCPYDQQPKVNANYF